MAFAFTGLALVYWIKSCIDSGQDLFRPEGFIPSIGWAFQWFANGSPKIPCLIICGYVALNLVADIVNIDAKLSPKTEPAQASRRSLGWYGARVSHIGVVMIFLGIAGSEGFGFERLERMRIGDTVTIEEGDNKIVKGKYEIIFDDLVQGQTIE
ncbi:MAG: hypothetical protein GY869_14175, partial [Planctomycetes bacterium]|nr:hypothetical protein [Planctomycetota bacterium]